MSGVIESATAVLSAAQRRLEVTATNVANVSTAGYKRQASYVSVAADAHHRGMPAVSTRTDLAQGQLRSTGNPLDLAIGGRGFFQLRTGDTLVYSRQGQFHRAPDGTIVSQQGQVLQQAGGGDLVLDSSEVTVAANGDVTAGGRQVGRVGVFAPAANTTPMSIDGSAFQLSGAGGEEVADPQLRQGMVEASNVSVGDEMITMMAALRQAESGARLVQTYDDLLGRAITSFGESGR